MNEIVTYKYYTHKKQRLAIQARPINLDETEITIIKCSNKDAFNKKAARLAFNDINAGTTPKINGNEIHAEKTIITNYSPSWKTSFFAWANLNYYKVGKRLVGYYENVLEGPGRPIKFSTEKFPKLIKF